VDVASWTAGKWRALRTLRAQRRELSNWREVFAAYRRRELLPTLEHRSGVHLHHGPEDDAWALFQEIFIDGCYTGGGFYEPRAGDTVLNLGANIGFFALSLAARERALRIHCFEPQAAARARLEWNVAANQLERAVVVHPVAVGREGTLRLVHAPQAGSASAFIEGGEAEEVASVSLDRALEICDTPEVALLKIDIEGGELEVVEGGSEATWRRIRRVALEYHEGLRPGCRERLARALRARFRDVTVRPQGAGALGIIRAA
jgi:FkbM family methyltransferase